MGNKPPPARGAAGAFKRLWGVRKVLGRDVKMLASQLPANVCRNRLPCRIEPQHIGFVLGAILGFFDHTCNTKDSAAQHIWLFLDTRAAPGILLNVPCAAKFAVRGCKQAHGSAAFLAQQPDARRLPVTLPGGTDGQLLPNNQHDGFFYALLQKIG